MKNFTFPLFLALAFLYIFSSCGTDPSVALQDEVIELHDEVMPLMVVLNRLGDSLQAVIDTKDELDASDSLNIIANIGALNGADEAMHVWMEEFQINTGDTAYLKEELNKMTKVKELTNTAIIEARKTLNRHED